jgi:hypothetical protein
MKIHFHQIHLPAALPVPALKPKFVAEKRTAKSMITMSVHTVTIGTLAISSLTVVIGTLTVSSMAPWPNTPGSTLAIHT